jgi:Fic family protein
MVTLVARKRGTGTYYYLKHHRHELYLGTEITKNIYERKKMFMISIYHKDWYPKLEQIQKRSIENRKKMPKSTLEQELKDFAIVFTYHTQKIEGSSLTRLDTEKLLRDGITPFNKPKSDMIEAELAEQVFFEMLEHKRQISVDTLRYWHTRMFNKTKLDIAGQIRDYDVHVHGSKTQFPSGDKVYDDMIAFFSWYHKIQSKINPVELAALTHLKFESIHLFGDGNGRVGRLLMNCILDEKKYPMLNISYAQRFLYYKALEKSNLEDDEISFLHWFVKTYINANKRWL